MGKKKLTKCHYSNRLRNTSIGKLPGVIRRRPNKGIDY